MKLDKMDTLVAAFFVATLIAAAGMLLDVWQAVYYSIPVFVALFMLIGSLNARNEWSRQFLVPVVAFAALVGVLFVVAGSLLDSTARLGGLPASTAVFFYVMWPVTVVGAPLVYAHVYQGWLSLEVADETGAEPAQDR
ncbi:hypothetical protein ABKW28_16600 [Nocardioides sp. 31GB23]|uniref:Uncharacterized protein n=1 Tax=Nocardioides salarius TaxID=374513 RepID=A0ABS2MA47_9ACTN|nr:hypothetical protein [Nocardioides salarius]MBM7508060.1 hypothetical protein [Nocardioides salarius]